METLKNIIRNNNMSARPEFYSGRGAIMCDLNGEILENIHNDIEKEYGKDAAKNFIKMIADIKVLSATTFLEELYCLFNRNWKYAKKRKHASGISIQKNEDGQYDVMHGMLSIFSALTSDRDETMLIKSNFLSKHDIKPKKIKYHFDSGIEEYYY